MKDQLKKYGWHHLHGTTYKKENFLLAFVEENKYQKIQEHWALYWEPYTNPIRRVKKLTPNILNIRNMPA